jgi:flagellar biosynthetic protein FlhB
MGDEDKSFEASQQKLTRLREEGQVIKSKDFSSALILLAMFAVLFAFMPMVWGILSETFVAYFQQIPYKHLTTIGWPFLMLHGLRALVITVLPFFVVAVVVAVMADLIQVGPLISLKVITPKFDKLNPVNGFKNIFSKRTVVELVKNLIKIGLLFYLAWQAFQKHWGEMLGVIQAVHPLAMMMVTAAILKDFIFTAALAFIAIGGFDYLYQRNKFLGDQKMSLKEVKDEYKQSEGDPMVKHMLKQKRMQLLQQRNLEAVPTADVVTTNPLHLAVAIKYNPVEMEAPKVVAKGAELFAQRIKDIATANNIPIVENALLAQTLYKVVDIENEIPADLYQAVAEVLMFAWNLKGQVPDEVEALGLGPANG